MSYNVKNYTEQGGEVTHIGGKLVIEDGASVEGTDIPSSYELPTASASTLGGIKVGEGLTITDGVLSADGITPVANQADSEADTIAALKEDFNTLLAAMKTAGIMAPDEP